MNFVVHRLFEKTVETSTWPSFPAGEALDPHVDQQCHRALMF